MKINDLKISKADIEGIDIADAAQALVLLLSEKNKTLASAESCTGGLFGATVTGVSGASAVYLGGVISYTNAVKESILGVSGKTLDTHTAVSEYTALEMARGARARLGSDFGVSVTGYAGPTGGDEKNPVGTVFVCALDGNCESLSRLSFDSGIGREDIRRYSVLFMISELIKAANA